MFALTAVSGVCLEKNINSAIFNRRPPQTGSLRLPKRDIRVSRTGDIYNICPARNGVQVRELKEGKRLPRLSNFFK
jgi:hypothetical protein